MENTPGTQADLDRKVPGLFANYQKLKNELEEMDEEAEYEISRINKQKQALVDKAKSILVPWAMNGSKQQLIEKWQVRANRFQVSTNESQTTAFPPPASGPGHRSDAKNSRIKGSSQIIDTSAAALKILVKKKPNISATNGYPTVKATGIPLLKNSILLGRAQSCIAPAIHIYEQSCVLLNEFMACVDSHAFNERIIEVQRKFMVEKDRESARQCEHVR